MQKKTLSKLIDAVKEVILDIVFSDKEETDVESSGGDNHQDNKELTEK